MKKIFLISLVLMLAFTGLSFAASASTYKYNLQVVDENGQPVTGISYVYVYTVNTTTLASIWANENTNTGTLSGLIAPDSTNAGIVFYSTATTVDVHFQFRGKSYVYESVAPGSERKLTVEKNRPEIDLATNRLTSSYDVVTVPVGGDFFLVDTAAISELAEANHTVGRTVKLLFGATTTALANRGTNLAVQGKVGTFTVGSGTLLEVVYDGTLWHAVKGLS